MNEEWDNIERVVNILTRMDAAKSQKTIDFIKSKDPELAQNILKEMQGGGEQGFRAIKHLPKQPTTPEEHAEALHYIQTESAKESYHTDIRQGTTPIRDWLDVRRSELRNEGRAYIAEVNRRFGQRVMSTMKTFDAGNLEVMKSQGFMYNGAIFLSTEIDKGDPVLKSVVVAHEVGHLIRHCYTKELSDHLSNHSNNIVNELRDCIQLLYPGIEAIKDQCDQAIYRYITQPDELLAELNAFRIAFREDAYQASPISVEFLEKWEWLVSNDPTVELPDKNVADKNFLSSSQDIPLHTGNEVKKEQQKLIALVKEIQKVCGKLATENFRKVLFRTPMRHKLSVLMYAESTFQNSIFSLLSDRVVDNLTEELQVFQHGSISFKAGVEEIMLRQFLEVARNTLKCTQCFTDPCSKRLGEYQPEDNM